MTIVAMPTPIKLKYRKKCIQKSNNTFRPLSAYKLGKKKMTIVFVALTNWLQDAAKNCAHFIPAPLGLIEKYLVCLMASLNCLNIFFFFRFGLDKAW